MSNNSPHNNAQSIQQGPPLTSSAPLSSAEMLGVFEHPATGMEFVPPSATIRNSREHEARRTKLHMETWKEISSQSESQRIPKSSLAKACQYETKRAASDSVVAWSVFFVLASLAGIIGGLAIKHFAF